MKQPATKRVSTRSACLMVHTKATRISDYGRTKGVVALRDCLNPARVQGRELVQAAYARRGQALRQELPDAGQLAAVQRGAAPQALPQALVQQQRVARLLEPLHVREVPARALGLSTYCC